MTLRNTLPIAGVLAACLVGMPAHAVQLYALADFGSTTDLYTIDTATLTTSLVGTSSVSDGFGLGDYNGRLFSYSQGSANEVTELSLSDGSTISTFDIGVTDTGEGAITFDASGTGYLARAAGTTGDLYSFSIGGSSHTRVGGASALVPSMDGMDFNSAGVLYGYSQVAGDLYTISTVDATTSLVGATGSSPGSLAGLTFDDSDNLYAITSFGQLWSLNASTGEGTLIGSTGLSGVSGLSALRAVPEPSTFGVLGLCIAALAVRRRRKGA
jgi:hypothetical protein